VDNSWLALLELLIGAMILLGWAAIELVSLRLDKRREEEKARAQAASSGAETPAEDKTQDAA
jgi:hypothetical protein